MITQEMTTAALFAKRANENFSWANRPTREIIAEEYPEDIEQYDVGMAVLSEFKLIEIDRRWAGKGKSRHPGGISAPATIATPGSVQNEYFLSPYPQRRAMKYLTQPTRHTNAEMVGIHLEPKMRW